MPAEPQPTDELLTGWGRTAPTLGHVHHPTASDAAAAVVKEAQQRGVIGRGLARSYGDAAQNAGGDVVHTVGLDRLLALDTERGRARVEAGVTLDWLMHTLVPLGWWPVVTPGTRQVTVGGAIGSDIHGKGHHRDGSFAVNVDSFVLETPGLGTLTVTPENQPDVFWATAGGMGLTGLILEATIKLLPIETSMMRVDSERCADLDTLMARMVETEAGAHYSVAWIDSLARGGSLGRSILELGEHARRDDLPATQRSTSRALAFAPFDRAVAPPWFPPGLLNRWTVAAFNELWFRKAPAKAEGHLIPAAAYFHPLDMVQGWNRIYGRPGFLQYQVVLPDGQEVALRTLMEKLSAAHCASFLTVLKRFGPGDPGPLSFPRPGWTLALDIPSNIAGLRPLLDRLDDLVVEAGGRVYLAKDSRLRPDRLEAMYPEIDRWRAVRDRLDPDRRLQSDLARRLNLLGSPRSPTHFGGSS
jgi:decaprenylphospho-beta-D-ribofuranose 2-oxidase